VARGFESKAVIEQQEEAERKRYVEQVSPPPDPAVQRARRGLELGRIDLQRRLAAAPEQGYLQASLQAGLDEIERQIAKLPPEH